MQTKRRKPVRGKRQRQGWGKPILVDLPETADARLESARGVLDRTTFVRIAVLEKLYREQAA